MKNKVINLYPLYKVNRVLDFNELCFLLTNLILAIETNFDCDDIFKMAATTIRNRGYIIDHHLLHLFIEGPSFADIISDKIDQMCANGLLIHLPYGMFRVKK